MPLFDLSNFGLLSFNYFYRISFLIILPFFVSLKSAGGQELLFSENMGSPAVTTVIGQNAFQNSNTLTYSSGDIANAADIRITAPASSGYTNASGFGYVFYTATTGVYGFSIGNIDASQFSNLSLTFGYYKSKGNALPSFSVDYWDGSSWVPIANTSGALFNEASNASQAWYISKPLPLPAAAQRTGLKLRFVKSGSTEMRIDDVSLRGCRSMRLVNSPSGSVCTQTDQVFTAVSGFSSYNWSFPGTAGTDYSIVSGGTSSSNQATIRFLTPGLKTVSVANALACSGTSPAVSSFRVFDLPPDNPQPIAYTGFYFCQGAQPYEFSIDSVTNASSYSWTVSDPGWTILNGNGTRAIQVSPGSSDAEISVVSVNGCGSSAPESTPILTALPGASAAVAIPATWIHATGFKANWNIVSNASGYEIDIYCKEKVIDDFTDGNFTSNPQWSGLTTNYSIPVSSSMPGANDGSYLGSLTNASNSALMTYSTEVNEWKFSLGSTNFQPGTTNFFGVILMSGNTITDISQSFNGYYLRITTAIELWKSAGLTKSIVGSFAISPAIGSTGLSAGLNIYVKRDSLGNFDLFYSSGFLYSAEPTTSAGRLNDNSIWESRYFGMFTNFNNITGKRAFIDNIVLGKFEYKVKDALIDANQFEICCLMPGTAYNYVVRTINQCDERMPNSSEIMVQTAQGCVSDPVISGFYPSEGPAGTLVTIIGNRFSTVSGVFFGSVSASSFTILSDTVISAIVPENAPNDPIKLTAGFCQASSFSRFVTLSGNNGCKSPSLQSSSIPGLFFYEILAIEAGKLNLVGLFNASGSAVNLLANSYSIRIISEGGGIQDIPLSGTVNNNSRYVLKMGFDNNPVFPGCPVSWDYEAAGISFNGNDRIQLLRSGIVIDNVNNPNFGSFPVCNFKSRRISFSNVPSDQYDSGQWLTSFEYDCLSIFSIPFSITAPSIQINSHPVSINACTSINFSVSATTSSGTLGYQWKFLNPSSGSWVDIQTLNAVALGVVVSNPTGPNLIITGTVANLANYQFFCRLSNNGCDVNSNAVRFTNVRGRFFRNKSSGNWSNPEIWEMSNDDVNWTGVVNSCFYPSQENSSRVYIDSGKSVTQDISIVVDFLRVNNGAVLSTAPNVKLFVNDSTAGADFIINGTWIYESSATNSFDLGGGLDLTGGSWVLGLNGTLVKTNNGSADILRDKYEGSMGSVPATARWILRYTGLTQDITFVTSSGIYAPFYPNLIFESVAGVWNPQKSFSGSNPNDLVIVKGNLDVGGTGSGIVQSLRNECTGGLISVRGDLIVRSGSTLTNAGTASGAGFNVFGNVLIDGTLNLTSLKKGHLRLEPTKKLSTDTTSRALVGTGNVKLQAMSLVPSTNSSLRISRFSVNTSASNETEIYDSLRVDNGMNLHMVSGYLALKSDSASTARLAPLGTGTLTYENGRFYVERFIRSGRKWQFLSVPTFDDLITQSVKSLWQEGANSINENPRPGYGTIITSSSPGWQANGFDTLSPGGPSMKSYNYSSRSYLPLSNTNNTIHNNTGYFLFVRGNRLSRPGNSVLGPAILRTRGKLKSGVIDFNFPDTGFHSVGNPYASAVDLRKLNLTNVPRVFYLWDPRLSGDYGVGKFVTCTYNAATTNFDVVPSGGSFGSVNNFIQSGQAFFIRASSSSASLRFDESHKHAASNMVFRPIPLQSSILRIDLKSLTSSGEELLEDGCMLDFDFSHSNSVDDNDAIKLFNSDENLAIKVNEYLLSVERRKPLISNDTVSISLTGLRNSRYLLKISLEGNGFPGHEMFLYDKLLGQYLALEPGNIVSYDINIADGTLIDNSNRFTIVLDRCMPNLPLTIRKP